MSAVCRHNELYGFCVLCEVEDLREVAARRQIAERYHERLMELVEIMAQEGGAYAGNARALLAEIARDDAVDGVRASKGEGR